MRRVDLSTPKGRDHGLMDGPPLSMVVIGVGAWGRLLAHEIQLSDRWALKGVMDFVPERACVVADELGVIQYRSLAAVWADETVRAVAVAVPNALHYEVCVEALQAGRDVILEKPMTLTRAEAESLCDLATCNASIVMVDHIERYFTPFVRLKEIVSSGRLGAIEGVSMRRRDYLRRAPGWLRQRKTVGGLLFQSACHEFDLMRWIIGEITSISCHATTRRLAPELDYADLVASTVTFDNGALGQLWNCMTDCLPAYDGTIVGTSGSVEFDLYDSRVTWKVQGAPKHVERWEPRDLWAPWAWITGSGLAEGESVALQLVISDFADACSDRIEAPITCRDGMRAVEVAQAGYLSLRDGVSVGLPLSGDRAVERAYLEA